MRKVENNAIECLVVDSQLILSTQSLNFEMKAIANDSYTRIRESRTLAERIQYLFDYHPSTRITCVKGCDFYR